MTDGSGVQSIDLGTIAAALGITKRAAEMRANREHWRFDVQNCRGGKKRIFALANLPPETQIALGLREIETKLVKYRRQLVALDQDIDALLCLRTRLHRRLRSARHG